MKTNAATFKPYFDAFKSQVISWAKEPEFKHATADEAFAVIKEYPFMVKGSISATDDKTRRKRERVTKNFLPQSMAALETDDKAIYSDTQFFFTASQGNAFNPDPDDLPTNSLVNCTPEFVYFHIFTKGAEVKDGDDAKISAALTQIKALIATMQTAYSDAYDNYFLPKLHNWVEEGLNWSKDDLSKY